MSDKTGTSKQGVSVQKIQKISHDLSGLEGLKMFEVFVWTTFSCYTHQGKSFDPVWQLFEVLSGGDVRLLRFDCLAGSCFGEEEEGNAIAGSGAGKGGFKKLGQIFSGHVETMMNIYGQFEWFFGNHALPCHAKNPHPKVLPFKTWKRWQRSIVIISYFVSRNYSMCKLHSRKLRWHWKITIFNMIQYEINHQIVDFPWLC